MALFDICYKTIFVYDSFIFDGKNKEAQRISLTNSGKVSSKMMLAICKVDLLVIKYLSRRNEAGRHHMCADSFFNDKATI